MNKVIILIFCLVFVIFTSCGDYNLVVKSTDYEYKYEAAKQFYAEGQYNRAATLMQDVIMALKGTDKGEESLFMTGMSHLYARNYEAATSYFRKYYETYPRGIFTEEARFYCGKALYENTPEPKLDQTATYEAVSEFQSFLELYPESQLRERAQNMIFALQDKLVEKEYLSAKLYYDLGTYFGNCTTGGSNYQACIVTAQNAIKDYPYTTRREEFAILILKAKFELAENSVAAKKEERYHDAIDEYYGFTNEYPESKYMKTAQDLFMKAKKYVSTEDADATEQSQPSK